MNAKTIAENLKRLMLIRGVSESRLAEMVGCSQTAINKFLTGKSEKTKYLVDIAEKLDVTVESLRSGTFIEVDKNASPGPDVVAYYPLLGRVPAGDFSLIYESVAANPETEWFPYFKKYEQAFYLRVQGDSMEPTLSEGDMVLVEVGAVPSHRSVVVVRNGSDESTIKRLLIDGEDRLLVPDNDRYPVRPLGPGATIIGVVRASFKEL